MTELMHKLCCFCGTVPLVIVDQYLNVSNFTCSHTIRQFYLLVVQWRERLSAVICVTQISSILLTFSVATLAFFSCK